QARAAGVALDVRPFVDHREVPAVLGEADVFVLPSRTEGHPKVLLEAMACARPCIASAVGGNLAIVEDGVTGLLFPAGDAGALADRVERLLRERALGAALGARARQALRPAYALGPPSARQVGVHPPGHR